jgi:hypothetical protein
MKLTAAAEALAAAGYFSRAERAQITSVYRLLGGVCNEMHTDDSFVFAKARVDAGGGEFGVFGSGCRHAQPNAGVSKIPRLWLVS